MDYEIPCKGSFIIKSVSQQQYDELIFTNSRNVEQTHKVLTNYFSRTPHSAQS